MERARSENIGDAVEHKGLGTIATRADVIEKLVKAGFVKREKTILFAPLCWIYMGPMRICGTKWKCNGAFDPYSFLMSMQSGMKIDSVSKRFSSTRSV